MESTLLETIDETLETIIKQLNEIPASFGERYVVLMPCESLYLAIS
jgi:hypothetical protein